ncbi:MAG: long-chain fatty acid--CoA ligase [Thermodesulfovibrionales bacterium]
MARRAHGRPEGRRPWLRVWPRHVSTSEDFPEEGAWSILERSAGDLAGKDAVIFLGHEDLSELGRVTYGELWKRANALAAGLRGLGVRKGDRVATLLPNSPAIIESYYGIWMCGAAVTPCNAMASEKELRYQIKDSGAKVLIAAEALGGAASSVATEFGLRLIAAPVGEPAGGPPDGALSFEEIASSGKGRPTDFSIEPANDMAVLLYTGGTTGDPKGAILTHRNIVSNTVQFAEWYGFERGGETCVCTIPMSHSGGMAGVMNVPLYSGATLVVMKRFKPEPVARAIEKYRATRFFGVPTMYVALLSNREACAHDMSSLKACRTNAAPLPVAVKEAFDRLVGREVLVEGYGLTETSPLTHANPIDRPKAGSIGIPLRGTDAKVIDCQSGEDVPVGCEGELVIRGPQVMKGYWHKPEATEKAMAGGWFHTGDIARMDEEGYFFIVDRLKDMINCGGYKVWPREVEEVLYAHPKVRLAAVIGVADDYYGEIVRAYIVPKEDAGDLTGEEIVAYCKGKMAIYKVPRQVEFRDSLPISPQGKVLRRLMREAARERPAREGCDVCIRRDE